MSTETNDNPNNAANAEAPAPQSRGNDAADVDKKLEAAQSAYKGMQRNYNELFSQATAKDAKISELENELARIKAEAERVGSTKSDVEKKLAEATGQVESLSAASTQAAREAEMFRIVATEFPELGGIVGNLGLSPKETAEATREMLSGIATALKEQASALAKAQVGAYNGGPVGATPNELSVEKLRENALNAAGTADYDKWASLYYARVQEGGDFPKPKRTAIDEIVLGV